MNNALGMQQIADWVQAPLVGVDSPVLGVSIDSRTMQPGELYVALRGERFDGHEFIPQVSELGAAGLMVEEIPNTSLPFIRVDNSRLALGDLAHGYRSRFDLPTVAITGSNGKTTVKEMVRQILSATANVCATEGNLNNEIGVPLTLLRLVEESEYLVVEMGANAPGEIGYLTDLVAPSIALVTCASEAHLAGFGSLHGVAAAKGEIYSRLGPTGTALINLDDPFFEYWQGLLDSQQQFSFGLDQAADFHAREIKLANNQFILVTPTGEIEVVLPVLGKHNIINAVAAAGVCSLLGIDLSQIASQLALFEAAPGRLTQVQGVHGARLINDTYNANPSSVTAAVVAVQSLPGDSWMALGDLAELGEEGVRLHQELGKNIKSLGISRLFTIGAQSQAAATAFGDGAEHFNSLDEMIERLKSCLTKNICLVVKGSRSAGMERVVTALQAPEECA